MMTDLPPPARVKQVIVMMSPQPAGLRPFRREVQSGEALMTTVTSGVGELIFSGWVWSCL